LFCNVTTVGALVVVISWLGNERLVAANMTGGTPYPVRGTVCGLFDTLSLTVKVPERVPFAVGANVTEIVQLPLVASVFGEIGQLEFWAKSPDVEIFAMLRGPVRSFVKVMTLAALVVFRNWLPNPREVGAKTTGAIPDPVNEAVWGVFVALSFTVRVPLCAPKAVGVNVAEILQLDLAARVLGEIGQFELWAKLPETEIAVMVKGAL